MSVARPSPERERDELILRALSLWDHCGLSFGQIAHDIGVSRNAVLGWVYRIQRADPEALKRKPKAAARCVAHCPS
jgi:hypothetical protein